MIQAHPDRIEKSILLRAPRSRVWRALIDTGEFGSWFGAKLSGKFEPGARVRGSITIPGFEHVTMELLVERVEPERTLAFRWHPYAVEPDVDYSAEPTTLVTFELSDAAEGTLLRATEAGFEQIPAARRAKAYEMNDDG